MGEGEIMVLCIVALAVFAFLGLFSAKYRGYAKESAKCVARMMTLRKCEASFDQKVQAKVTGVLAKKLPGAARFVFKNFVLLSWIFVIAFFLSIVYTGVGVYNYFEYGSCDPHSDFCIYDALAGETGVSCGSEHCATEGCDCGEKDTNCTEANNYSACDGQCDCYEEVCG